MLGNLWWRVIGVMLLLATSGWLVMLLHTAIVHIAIPLIAGDCPGNPECG